MLRNDEMVCCRSLVKAAAVNHSGCRRDAMQGAGHYSDWCLLCLRCSHC